LLAAGAREAAVILDPDRYLCPVHDVDLTEVVVARLREDEDAELAYGGVGGRGGRSAARPRQFQVLVSCPGGGTPHRHVCEGTYTP
jgi:hypothetical protein